MNAPKLVESIPSTSRPVDMPKLSREKYLAGLIAGGVIATLDIAGLIFYSVAVGS